jgi:hypothetical protein
LRKSNVVIPLLFSVFVLCAHLQRIDGVGS